MTAHLMSISYVIRRWADALRNVDGGQWPVDLISRLEASGIIWPRLLFDLCNTFI